MEEIGFVTVEQAADVLCMNPPGIRRLLKSGKLEGLKEKGRLLVKPESVQAYAAAQKHPPVYMAVMRDAQTFLGNMKRIRMYSMMMRWGPGTIPEKSQEAHFERYSIPAQALLDALKAGDYGAADEARAEMWREITDYEMLYKPVPHGETRKPPPRPVWVMDPLFEDEELN